MPSNVISILIEGKDQFSPKAQKAKRSAKGLQGGMASLGKAALAVGAGFVAAQVSIAGVSRLFSSTIGAAVKFEFQLAQIRALTGATTEDTDFLSGAIKDMARTMPKSPAELGAGAYFILSSGIEDASDAANVLEVAAKASTIGLGETERVADALTTVLNAYGLSADKAGHVTDVMIEAVKQGKAEADAFAGVLGRVVPLAAQMGITFEEVAANLATFTRLGVSADEAATGLRAVMNTLIKPTTDTSKALEEMGLSAEGVREQIREKGLLAALAEMIERTGGNETAIARLFPNIRALTSVLGTAGVQLEDYNAILGATENATGNLEEGFGIVSDTAQFKMQVAIGELNVALLELGEMMLPLVTQSAVTLSDIVKTLSGDFSGLKGITGDVVKGLKNVMVWNLKGGLANEGLMAGVKGTVGAVKDLGQAFGVFGPDTQRQMFDTGEMANRMAARNRKLADEAAVAAARVTTLGGAVDELASSLALLAGAQSENLSVLNSLAGARTQEQVAIDLQVNALRQELNAAEQASIGQEKLGSTVGSTTDALDQQIGALRKLAASMVPQALNNEIIALDRELKVLRLGKLEIEAQINARNRLASAMLAMANIANLPELLELKKLELQREQLLIAQTAQRTQLEREKAEILAEVGGKTADLTDEDRARIDVIDNILARMDAELDAINAQMEALNRSIRVRTLEAEIINLEAEASDKNREAMQRELNKIIEQIGATDNLRRRRELYIDTLIPVELLQEIDALERQKTQFANVATEAAGAGGAIRGVTDILGDQIRKLELERQAIDLVTEGWRLQTEAMLNLPTTTMILQGFKEAMISLLRAAMLGAIAAGDTALQRQIAAAFNDVLALQQGTPSFRGGMALLGERGPELAMLPTGTRVLNAGQTAQAIGGSTTINLTLNVETLIGGDEAMDELGEILMPVIRRLVT